MSRTHDVMKQINNYPSIHDGFQFAINKSIGTLMCSSHHAKLKQNNIAIYRSAFRHTFSLLNRLYLVDKDSKPWKDEQINVTLHSLNHLMSSTLHQHPHKFVECIRRVELASFTLSQIFLYLKCASEQLAYGEPNTDMTIAFIRSIDLEYETSADHIDFINDDHMVQTEWKQFWEQRRLHDESDTSI